jgi:hypothetical protein
MRTLAAVAVLNMVVPGTLLLPVVAACQDVGSEPASVHWAYSAYFGTGWYTVPGDRDVFVLRMTPRWTWSDPATDGEGWDSYGKYLKAPVSVGLNQFDENDPLDAADLDNVSFLSVNPGLDVEIPVAANWALRPCASVGFATALGASESAVTYWAGIKSEVAFRNDRFDWYLVNQAGYVGYTPDSGLSDEFWPVLTAFEFDHPFGDSPAGRAQLIFHWRFAYTAFGRNIVFNGDRSSTAEISDQWDIGAAIRRRNSPIRIWFLSFERLGLGYRRSSSGDLEGVTFFFRSLFDE